jgi:hypothetical protein
MIFETVDPKLLCRRFSRKNLLVVVMVSKLFNLPLVQLVFFFGDVSFDSKSKYPDNQAVNYEKRLVYGEHKDGSYDESDIGKDKICQAADIGADFTCIAANKRVLFHKFMVKKPFLGSSVAFIHENFVKQKVHIQPVKIRTEGFDKTESEIEDVQDYVDKYEYEKNFRKLSGIDSRRKAVNDILVYDINKKYNSR